VLSAERFENDKKDVPPPSHDTRGVSGQRRATIRPPSRAYISGGWFGTTDQRSVFHHAVTTRLVRIIRRLEDGLQQKSFSPRVIGGHWLAAAAAGKNSVGGFGRI